MLDITSAKQVAQQEDEGSTVDVMDAAGNTMDGVTITVAGSYSKRYRAGQETLRKWGKRHPNPTDEQAERKVTELLAACVLGWTGIASDGQPIPVTPDNAVALMEAAPWVRTQIDKAIHDHAAFFVTVSSV